MLAWILAISTQVTDAHGWHFAAIPTEGASAIAKVCSATSIPKHCAAVLVVLAARESGYHAHAVGDGGRSKGAWQTLARITPDDWDGQAAIAWRLVVESTAKCREPLAYYASGKCSANGERISRERMSVARRLAEMP